MRRRAGSPEIITIYWRDIPAQVNVGQGRNKQQAILEHRFQTAIDRAAVVAGLTETDSYVAQWRRETSPISGEVEQAAMAEAARLEAAYPSGRLEQLVQNGGIELPSDATSGDRAEGVQPTELSTEVDQ